MIAAAYAARFWLKANLPTISNWVIGLVRFVPAASSDCLKPGAAAMSALLMAAPKPPNGGNRFPTPLSHDAVPAVQLTRAGELRYKLIVR
jgi:hypothetical protein